MLKRFEALDSLRGVCALFVLLFHTRLVGSIAETEFFRNSFVFVDFFFVLSGFVLAHGYAFRDNINFTQFLSSRFWRIYPLHFFMFLMFFIFEVGKYVAHTYFDIAVFAQPFSGSGAFSEIIPNLLLIQSWFPQFRADSFNGVSWSISVEFYMYLIFIVTVLLGKNYKAYIWFIISFFAFYTLLNKMFFLRSEVLHGLSCFFLGSLIYIIRKKINERKVSFVFFTLLEFFTALLVYFCVSTVFVNNYLFATFVFATSVFIFSFEGGLVSKLLVYKKFVYIGALSYSIYMTHGIVLFIYKSLSLLLDRWIDISFFSISGNTFFLDFGNVVINNFMVAIIVALSLLLSHFTYNFIELRYKK